MQSVPCSVWCWSVFSHQCFKFEAWLTDNNTFVALLVAIDAFVTRKGASQNKKVLGQQAKSWVVQVLAVFMGEGFCAWRSPDELLPFRRFREEKEIAASALDVAHRLPKPHLFRKGLQVWTF